MSTTIDNRVLEMRFDNKQFESGVATSMSTLEKLKQKLNLSGASKGLENINAAAKNVNLSGISSGVEAVRAKFSALEVIGVTALANITNQAVNAGKRVASALTIDPIKTGFQEYETQINAIQTILANTQKEGTTVDVVNKALDELNLYADKTIYNFTEMTRNIGTFTAAGVKLQTSVDAIQGIANLAAVSGSTSQQASTAMYQLSQALASGTVKLMDWNSVVNAGMGGQLFQDALMDTARAHGVAIDQMIKDQGSFRETLQKGWLTSEVLVETLKKFTTSGSYEKIAEYTGLEEELVQQTVESCEKKYDEAEAIDKAAEALAKKSGKNKEEIKSTLQFAKTAEDAATKVKTFSQLWDTLKEAAQSGWSQSWRIIVGDFEEAKELFTGLSDFLGGFIGKSAESRNAILEGALAGNPFSKLAEKIESVTGATEAMTAATKDYDAVVTQVINGEFGNGQERFDALAEAGYDWAHVQNLVNERLGNAHRYATDYNEAQEDLNETQQTTIEDLVKMSDAQLKNLGFTKSEIKAFRELQEQSEKTGIPINDLVKDLDQLNGRTLMLNSFKNIGNGLVEVFEAVGTAWRDIFWDGASEEDIIAKKTEMLYNAIAAFHKFSTYLKPENLPIEELTRTFKGLFAAADIVATLFGGGLKLAFKAVSSVLGAFDMNVFDLTANIGDAIVAFRDWLFEGNLLAKSINGLVDKLPGAIRWFRDWFDVFKETPAVKKFVDAIEAFKSTLNALFDPRSFGNPEDFVHDLGVALGNALKSIPEIMIQIGKDIWAGFQNGIETGFDGSIISKIVSFALEFISGFAEALGVQSPSWKAYDIAVDFFQGLINGIKAMFSKVTGALGDVGDGIIDVFTNIWEFLTDESGNINWDKIFAVGLSVGAALFGKKVLGIFENLTDPLGGVGDILQNFADGLPKLMKNIGKSLKGLKSLFKGMAFEYKTEGIKNLATAILMLVGAVAIITLLDPDRLWEAVGVIGVLVGIIAALAIATSFLSESSLDIDLKKGTASLQGLKQSLASIAAAILMVALSVKLLGGMEPDEIKQGLLSVASIAGGLLIFATVMGFITKGNLGNNADKVGKMMSKLAFSMLLMIAVIKLVGTISEEEAWKGVAFAIAFGIFVVAITKVAKSAGNNVGKVGGMILKIAIAMALMVGVVKLVGKLSKEEMLKGAAFAAGFAVFVWALVKATKIGKKQQIAKITGMLLSISVAMLAMAGVCKLIGGMDIWSLAKGMIAVGLFGLLIILLINTVKGNEGEVAKLSGTLIAFAVAIGVLAAVAFIMGQLDPQALIQGLAAVGILSLFMMELIKATEKAGSAAGPLIAMSVAIAVMAAAVAALSFLDPTSLIAPTIAIGVLMGMFALMAKMSGNLQGSMGAIIAMTVAVGVIAAALGILAQLNPTSLIAPTIAMGVLMGMFAVMLKSMKGSDVKLRPLIAITAVIAVFAGILYLLNGIDPISAIATVGGIVILLAALLVAMNLSSKASALNAGVIVSLVIMTAIIAVLGLVISQLKGLDQASAIAGVVGIAILLTSLVGVLYLCSGLASVAGKAIIGAVVLGAFMILLAGVIWVIAQIGKDIISDMPGMAANLSLFMVNLQPFLIGSSNIPDGLLGKLASLSAGMVILGAASFVTSLLNLLTNFLGTSMPQLAAELSAFMINLQPFLIGSSMIPDGIGGKLGALSAGMIAIGIGQCIVAVTNLISNWLGTSMPQLAAELSAFMINLQPFLIGSSMIPDGIGSKLGALSAGMIAIGIGQCVTAVTNLISNWLGTSMPQLATELSLFMTNLTPFLIGSSMIPDGIGTKLGALSAGMIAIGTGQCVTAVTNLISNWLGTSMPQLATELSLFMTNLTPFLVGSAMIPDNIGAKLGSLSAGMVAIGIGQCVTAVTNLISNWLGTGMPRLATEMSSFMTNLLPFLIGLSFVPDNVAAKATALSAAMVALGVGNALTALTNLLSNIVGQDLPSLGEDLGSFMTNVTPFLTGISSVPDDIAAKVELLTTAIGDLSSENFWKNIKEFFSGGDDASLANLGTELTALGNGMLTFSTAANNFSVSSETIASVTSFIDDMEEIDSDSIEKVGDLASSLTDFGTAISGFATTTAGMDSSGISTALSAAYKLKWLVESLSDIDISGVAIFTGIGTGGVGADGPISDIAEAIADFGEKTSEIDISSMSTSVSAALRLKTLISGLAGLDPNGIENFKISAIGTALNKYFDKVSGVDTGVISKSISAANRLKLFIASLAGLDAGGIKNFKPGTIGTSLKSYSASVLGFDATAVNTSISAATRLKIFIAGLAGLDTGGVSSFVSAIEELGTVSVDNIVKSFSGASTEMLSAGSKLIESVTKGMKSKQAAMNKTVTDSVAKMYQAITTKASAFGKAGYDLMMKLASGIASKSSGVAAAASSAIASAVSRIRSNYMSFYAAGTHLGSGLVVGINSKRQAAYDAGFALGQAAVRGEKDGQQSNSPSKLTIQAGKWIGEGLVIGIKKMGNSVYNAGYKLGDTAANSMSNSIAKISDAINGGMDAEPTIRPVLDLSAVEAGAGAISGMFSNGLAIGASANVSAISSMMNQRNQNGVNDDVVYAINKLNKKMDGIGNTTYSINGITYDDGSNISEAVKALVRAAKMEGRV